MVGESGTLKESQEGFIFHKLQKDSHATVFSAWGPRELVIIRSSTPLKMPAMPGLEPNLLLQVSGGDTSWWWWGLPCSPSARLYCNDKVKERRCGAEGKDQPGRSHYLGKEHGDGNERVCGQNREWSPLFRRIGTGGKRSLRWKSVAKLKEPEETKTRILRCFIQ